MLYTWNKHNIVNQLYFNKKERTGSLLPQVPVAAVLQPLGQ